MKQSTNKKIKYFTSALRPSQSLHSQHFKKSLLTSSTSNINPKLIDNHNEISIFIIYKQKQISFQVKK